jgi:hypothetical protein
MAISKPQGPTGGAAVVGRAVAHLMSRGPGALPAVAGAAAPQTSQPIRLFMLNLKDITDDSFLKKAVPVGWRYIIVGPGPIAVADVKETGGGGPPGFASLIRGKIAERLEQASEFAQQYEAKPGIFEPRILEIPSLYITALWLHGPQDIFIPFLEGGKKDATPVKEDSSFIKRVVQEALKHSPVGLAFP